MNDENTIPNLTNNYANLFFRKLALSNSYRQEIDRFHYWLDSKLSSLGY